jgi:ethanolamine utilization protein EutQ (cupin superfamily)
MKYTIEKDRLREVFQRIIDKILKNNSSLNVEIKKIYVNSVYSKPYVQVIDVIVTINERLDSENKTIRNAITRLIKYQVQQEFNSLLGINFNFNIILIKNEK